MNDVYDEMKEPAYVGQLRARSWRYLIEPTGDSDPTWSDRARAYWERQEKRFGLVMSDYILSVDYELGTVTTFSAVKAIKPGIRRPAPTRPASLLVLH